MNDTCAKCGSEDLAFSCGGGRWLFRVAFCNCGWDSLERDIERDRAKLVAMFESLPESEREQADSAHITYWRDTPAQQIAADLKRSWELE